MNPKLERYRAERDKNSKRIAALQDRNKVLDEMITKMEDNDIIGMVREMDLTPEQLAKVLAALKGDPAAAMRGDLGVPGVDPKEGCEDAMAALHADDSVETEPGVEDAALEDSEEQVALDMKEDN